jgi:hypothetical protein
MTTRVTLGCLARTGRAIVVALRGPPEEPAITSRSEIALVDDVLPPFVYHAAQEMPPAEAVPFVERARRTIHRVAHERLAEITTQGRERDEHMIAAGIVMGDRPLSATLDRILGSHALVHAAEGELYRAALVAGAEELGIRVVGAGQRELLARLAAVADLRASDLTRRLTALGRAIGPPWRQYEKHAAAAAWIALIAAWSARV